MLAVTALHLVKAMIKGSECARAIADGALDLIDDLSAGSGQLMRGDHPTLTEPPFEEIEEMDTVLDEYTATFFPVPEPVLGCEGFVLRGIYKRGIPLNLGRIMEA